MPINLIRWFGDILQGKRNPHWLHLAFPSAVAAASLYWYLRDRNLSYVPPEALLTHTVQIAVSVALFFLLFSALLIHFNARAKDTHSSIVVFNGELRYEDEIHIALHIVTLKNLIRSMVAKVRPEEARQALFDSGMLAGLEFGKSFPVIYEEELKGKNRDIRWADLGMRDRLYLWAEFDKGAGWGRFSVVDGGSRGLFVEVHHVSLFTGDAGQLVGQFMAGYVMGVVQQLVGRKVSMIEPPEISRGAEDRLLVKLST